MHAIFVTFQSSVPAAELEEGYRQFAEGLRGGAARGFVAKTWVSGAPRMGGFYLFQDRQTADDYIAGMLAPALEGDPRVSDVRIEHFDVNDELSGLTHGVPALAVHAGG
jgi:hypothetical protein